MADFNIKTTAGDFRYSTDPARLTGPDGSRVDLSRFAYAYVDPVGPGDQIAFHPDNPVAGKDAPKVLKIQLGLGCNYACSYCSQGRQVEDGSSAADAVAFLALLDDSLRNIPEKIEFWGGEPLLYAKKLDALVPALRARFPDAKFSMVTNGTLLTLPLAQWLYGFGFTLSVSHDGPGQHRRGEDPFDSAEWVEMIRDAFRLFGDRATFNTVITQENMRLAETAMWFEDRMGFRVKLNIEDVVTDYGGALWAEQELHGLHHEIRDSVSSSLALAFPRMRWSVQQFLETLAISKPLAGAHQVCGMDRKDRLAVDLHGNVLTCQNAGAKSGHQIGSIGNLPAVMLDTATSYMQRPHCSVCPVVHLCYGSCMFLDGNEFASSCATSYWYNRGILEGAIELLTGAKVISIDGWAPSAPRRSIPIRVAA